MSSSKSKGEQRKKETSPERNPNIKGNTPKKSLDDSGEDKDKNSGDIRRSSRPQKRKLLDQDFFESDVAAKKLKLNPPSSPTTPSKPSSTPNKSKSSSRKKDKKSSSKQKSEKSKSSSSSSSRSSSASSESSSESSDDENSAKSSKSSSSSSSKDSNDEKSSSSSSSSKSSKSSRSSKSSSSSSSGKSSKSSSSSKSSGSSKSSKSSKSKDESSESEGTEQAKPIRMFWTEDEERELVDALRKGPFVSFQKILDEIKDAFHPSRTAKSLEAHFYRMKRKGAVDRDIPQENLPKPSKVKRQSFSFRKSRRKSEPRKRKPRPKKPKVEKKSAEESSESESGKSGAEKSKEENKSKSKSENKSATPAKEKTKKNGQHENKNTEKKSTATSSDKKSTPAKKDKTPQKKDADTPSKTPQKKDSQSDLKKSADSAKKSNTPSKIAENKKVTEKSRSNSNLSRPSVDDKSENSAKKSTDKSENKIGSPTMPFKKITKDYSKANRSKKVESIPTAASTVVEELNNTNKVVSPPSSTEQLKRSSSSRRREKSAEESSPVLSPMQPQVRSKRISERRERQMKEGTSESTSFRHADYIDSSLISTPPSAPETLPMPEDETSNSAYNNNAMEIDQGNGAAKSPRLSPHPNPLKKSRSAGTSDKFLEFETACLEEAIRNQAQFEHFISSIDNVDATLAKIDYSIKEIQALQNIQKLEREIERALDMHGIRDSSLALLRGFHLRYTMKTQKIVLGRPAANNTVDVNLLDESGENGNRISRRQALIKLKYDGEFYIKNLGSLNLYVNGELIQTGARKKLSHNCLIEVGNVSLIFEINKHQLQMIRDRLQELEDQELAEQQRLEEERKQQELSLAADHMNTSATTNNTNTIASQMMNVNDFLADPHPPVGGPSLADPMQLEPASGLSSTNL